MRTCKPKKKKKGKGVFLNSVLKVRPVLHDVLCDGRCCGLSATNAESAAFLC